MPTKWCYFLFLLWYFYLLLCSVLLFTRGFLLTRVASPTNSSCDHHTIFCNEQNSQNQCINEDYHLHKNEQTCLQPKSKVVLLVIDALRYDFATYNAAESNPLPFQNKLPIIDYVLRNFPNSSRLYKFIADPPTTTMQRLKALTTGSLPTFIDAGSNFATAEINEDNLIDQLNRRGGKVIFMGDDTWSNLYPNRFTRSYPFPSFNVHDLDTVDNGVFTHLFPEIERDDFDLLIGHFLGVDHCGHRYGPFHPEMSRKLNEMNNVIELVLEKLKNDTTLIVIGDHGMTTTGDHGGSSDSEITSAMFVYSQKPLADFTSPESIKQVDLVPTLSAILGIPIPFSNLGVTVIDSIPNDNWRILLQHLWSNIQQVVKYIEDYSTVDPNTFDGEVLRKHMKTYNNLQKDILNINTKEDFERFSVSSSKFLIELRNMCEDVWIQFDSFSMTRGLLILFLSTFFVFLIVDGVPINLLHIIFTSTFICYSYVAMAFAATVSCVLYYLRHIDDLLLNVYFTTSIVSLFMLAVLIVQTWEAIAMYWYERRLKSKLQDVFVRLILVLNVCTVFSNSFVVEEASALLYLYVSIITFTYYIAAEKDNKKWKLKFLLIFSGLAVALLTRFSTYFWQCREEQEWCLTLETFGIQKSLSGSQLDCIRTVISLSVQVILSKIWLRNCGNLTGNSVTILFARYAPTAMAVCIGGYWILRNIPQYIGRNWQPDFLPWTVYSLFIIGTICVVLDPLTIYVVPNSHQYEGVEKETLVPQIFQQVKRLFEKRKNSEGVPVVYGLATIYSSSYLIVGILISLVFSLLLGGLKAPSFVVYFFTFWFTIAMLSSAKISTVTKIDELFDVSGLSIITISTLSQYFFFGTGHQPSFPNIAWEAAFVGTGTTFINNYVHGLLVLLNTFGSYIFGAFMLPLLIIFPFTMFVVNSSLIPKIEKGSDLSRGEVLLYERSNSLFKSAFVICCKYAMCHCLKVFACMMSATIHCRHLMVWKIFAPKLIFESVALLITLISLLVSYVFLIRVHGCMDNFVSKLRKQS